ncbi:TPA: hypothetical protein HA338_07735 [Methanosarcina acetivorans]|uniref:DUF3303 domain-containing protein n=2 Tax=Methanosarcina acetivorans TaxID=2214 RepID=Q8TPW1_METAC|nr:DUF3303 family protein [Methanosarcina acetivorans]AAM05199.1 predicted protein [Methanosarcina acetivorans C2A]HIH93924.1 hypothetical protein [Methanosarcina acetivorans]
MLLMDIITWEPKDSEKVKSCYVNYEYPQGLKVIDEWMDLAGYRMFLIYEADDEKVYAAANLPFIGLCRFETFPVMKPEKYMETIQELAGKTGQRIETSASGEGAAGEEIRDQIENLEKRIQRLEHHSFIRQEDTT